MPVLRPDSVEMSVWGVASLAGLGAGVWTSVEEVITIITRQSILGSDGMTKSDCSLSL